MAEHPRRPHLNKEGTTIDDMPVELTDAVISSLRPHDLTVLARVSKKYREIAQSALWRSIELHRQDEHHEIFGLTTLKGIRRSHLDNQLLGSWSYRLPDGHDHVFNHHNAKFATAVRKLFRTAGKSQAWTRLAPFVQHMCLTVTYRSPPQIWDMILSLPNLVTIEIVGENSIHDQGPPQPNTLRAPEARKIQDVRLRGYLPAKFVLELCRASASSITHLDLGALEPPKLFYGDAGEMELQNHLGYPLYVAPRGVLWLSRSPTLVFKNMTRLLLCRRGSFDGFPDMSEEEDFEIREDDVYECMELKQWASLLCSVRTTIVEVVLEQRPVYLSYLFGREMGISPYDKTSFYPELHDFDSAFYSHVLKPTFDDGEAWPKLKSLTLRGINLAGFEDEAGETLQAFADRTIPGVIVQEVPGNYMFFSTRRGTILNQNGTDGLKPHLDPNSNSRAFVDENFGNFFF